MLARILRGGDRYIKRIWNCVVGFIFLKVVFVEMNKVEEVRYFDKMISNYASKSKY